MYVLAIETATLSGSLALGKLTDKDCDILFSKRWLRQRSHGELLTASIEEALSVAQISINDLSYIAVDIGPGSFTGIRIGTSVVKTLGYALKIPIVPIHSLQTLASAVSHLNRKVPLVVLVNAHKSQVYFAKFKPLKTGWKLVGQPKAISISQLEKHIPSKCLCIGDGYSVVAQTASKGLLSRLGREIGLDDYPQAQTMVRFLVSKKIQSKSLSWSELEALYIRQSEAEEKLKTGILKPLPSF